MPGAAWRLWERVFFRPAAPLGLLACRWLVSLQALWILLSRPDLPELVSWPAEFWSGGDPLLRARFGLLGLPLAVERGLYAAAHVSLLGALLGVAPGVACAASAALLYHFAPLEELLVGMPHTSFGGLTLPVLALFVLAFAERPRWRDAPSAEFRWPLALIQLLFAFSYLFPTLAKLRYSGPGWFTGDTIRNYLLGNHSITQAPWALALAGSPAACWAIALGTLALELLSPLTVVWPGFALAFALVALAFHYGILQAIGYFFPSAPLLLLFLDWDGIARALARRGGSSPP